MKILLVILLIPIIAVAVIIVAGLLAGLLGVAIYYCIEWLLIGIVVLAIFWIVKEHSNSKN
jgi:hypothetical protein